MKSLFASFVLAAATFSVLAAPQTVTLSVPGMTCAACQITVKKALCKVDGVTQAKVSCEKREAIIFDDSEASVHKLVDASTNSGYPASVKR